MRILVHDFGAYPFCLELSREMARRGYDVQHVFFPAASTSMRNMEPRAGDTATLEIVPLGADLSYPKYSLLRRRFQEVAFGRRLSRRIAEWHPDIVISANAPLDVQKRAVRAARMVNARFVFWLQDIISVAMSDVLSRRLGTAGTLLARYYTAVERNAARQSDKIICISKDFIPILEQWGIPPARYAIIENWAPKDDICPRPKDNPWSRKHGLHDKKVFLYAGRLGFKHNPGIILELASKYRDDPNIAVVVVAEGLGAEWLTERKKKTGLRSLTVLPFQPYTDLPDVLATGDVLVCVIEPSASLYSVPSKVLSYLAAGRAILAAISERNLNARHITRVGAGAVVDPRQPQAILAAARMLMEDDMMRSACAERARAYAEEAFDIGKIADRFIEIMVSPDGVEPSAL